MFIFLILQIACIPVYLFHNDVYHRFGYGGLRQDLISENDNAVQKMLLTLKVVKSDTK